MESTEAELGLELQELVLPAQPTTTDPTLLTEAQRQRAAMRESKSAAMLKLLAMHESELAKLLLPYRSMHHAADGLSRKLDCTIHATTLEQVLLERNFMVAEYEDDPSAHRRFKRAAGTACYFSAENVYLRQPKKALETGAYAYPPSWRAASKHLVLPAGVADADHGRNDANGDPVGTGRFMQPHHQLSGWSTPNRSYTKEHCGMNAPLHGHSSGIYSEPFPGYRPDDSLCKHCLVAANKEGGAARYQAARHMTGCPNAGLSKAACKTAVAGMFTNVPDADASSDDEDFEWSGWTENQYEDGKHYDPYPLVPEAERPATARSVTMGTPPRLPELLPLNNLSRRSWNSMGYAAKQLNRRVRVSLLSDGTKSDGTIVKVLGADQRVDLDRYEQHGIRVQCAPPPAPPWSSQARTRAAG